MLSYHTRILQAYLGRGTSQLSFWHERPEVNEQAFAPDSRQFYMTFADKARYAGPFDEQGIPLLDYRGNIGRQYNPIAVAQYGLACWNQWEKCSVFGVQSSPRPAGEERRAEDSTFNVQRPTSNIQGREEFEQKATKEGGGGGEEEANIECRTPNNEDRRQTSDLGPPTSDLRPRTSDLPPPASSIQDAWQRRFLACADWLVEHLEKNAAGLRVWQHHFDWRYFRTLRAPWYSGLAQGQGVALLLRAHAATEDGKYRDAAESALAALVTRIEAGGCLHVDAAGDGWIEEYLTEPPTHILNGFIWALWGVRDYGRWPVAGLRLQDQARLLWEKSLDTLERNLGRYDCGYWSLYDRAATRIRNPASPFYHRLHIVQMEVMYRLSQREIFRSCGERWQSYERRAFCHWRALVHKVIFKLGYY
jgi:hypothetical protein